MGAYDFGSYRRDHPQADDPRYQLAIKALQKLLQFSGRYQEGTVDGIFGDKMHRSMKRFQYDSELTVDGLCGPKTCKALVIPLARDYQVKHHILNDYLCGMVRLESAYDPVAVGWVDPADRGLGQINLSAHPDVSDEKAFDPWFALEWGAETMRSAYNTFKDDCPDRAWSVVILNHNRPVSARQLCAGGWEGIQATSTRTAEEEQARCRQYVALVELGA